MMKFPKLQAHRGYWQSGDRENSLAAFAKAKQLGYSMFECDVRLSKDHVPVVFHDLNLKRLFDRSDLLSDLTARQLWHQFEIPSLEQVLVAEDRPEWINIEIKNVSMWDRRPERAVLELLQKFNDKKMVISSFNPLALRWIKARRSDLILGLLATRAPSPRNIYFLRELKMFRFSRADFLDLDVESYSEEEIYRWQQQSVPVVVWTVNSKEKAQRLLELGVDSIISDQVQVTDLP